MICSKEEVRRTAERRKVDTSTYTDSDIEMIIAQAQQKLEIATGRVFDTQEFTDKLFNIDVMRINLSKWPVQSIEHIQVNGEDVPETEYRLDPKTGVIHLNRDYMYVYWPATALRRNILGFDFCCEYTAGYEPAHVEAKSICIDLTVGLIKQEVAPVDGRIQQFQERYITVIYDRSNSSVYSIDDRIKKLTRPAMFMG